MPGPCSMPDGDKSEWEKLNELTCNRHPYCWFNSPSRDYKSAHEWVTLRVWLMQRSKLRTGKTR